MQDAPVTEQRPVEINVYHRLELGEIFDRTRGLDNIRAQAGTFIGTANLTVLGIAFSTEKAGLLFIAAGLLVLLVLADTLARRKLAALYKRGMQLERIYSPEPEDSILYNAGWGGQSRLLGRFSVFGLLVPGILVLVELAAGIFLWLFARWALF